MGNLSPGSLMICTKNYEQNLVLSRNTLKVQTRDTTIVNVLGLVSHTSHEDSEIETAVRVPGRNLANVQNLPAPRHPAAPLNLVSSDSIKPGQDAAISGAAFGVSVAGVIRTAGWLLTVPFFSGHYIAIGVAAGVAAACRQLEHSFNAAEDRRRLEAGMRLYVSGQTAPRGGAVSK